MISKLGPECFNAAYFGHDPNEHVSNYHTPYGSKGISRSAVRTIEAFLIATEFWRKKGFNKLNILDVGGATGVTASTLNRFQLLGIKAFSTDLSAWATQNAVTSMKSRIVQADVNDLPFKNASFDGLVSFDVLEHVPENIVSQGIREMHRVLREGGRAIIVVNTGDFGDFEKDITHVTKRNVSWWQEQFIEAGFSIADPVSFPGRRLLSHNPHIAWRFKIVHPSLIIADK
ncbi:MAG: class I SAM-dependent methyltransferase [Patescibacteria group bacterium]|nr:class I SAM-dependent methyltransferase [Patescibacteria group bacterium]